MTSFEIIKKDVLLKIQNCLNNNICNSSTFFWSIYNNLSNTKITTAKNRNQQIKSTETNLKQHLQQLQPHQHLQNQNNFTTATTTATTLMNSRSLSLSTSMTNASVLEVKNWKEMMRMKKIWSFNIFSIFSFFRIFLLTFQDWAQLIDLVWMCVIQFI